MWYSQAPDGRGRKGVGQFPNFRLLLKYFPSFSNSPLPHVIGNPPSLPPPPPILWKQVEKHIKFQSLSIKFQKLKKILDNSSASNASATNLKIADYSMSSLKVTKLSKF